MIVVDTSVWIDHLHTRSSTLSALLDTNDVMTHPFVIGELACGTLVNRSEVLRLLAALPSATVATHDEVMMFVEQRRLMGIGIGYIDAHLLASVLLTSQARLWTTDKRLLEVASQMRLAFDSSHF